MAKNSTREKKIQNTNRRSQEIDNVLNEYEVAFKANLIDTDVLKNIYSKGSLLISRARLSGKPITKELMQLAEAQKRAKDIIDSLEEMRF